MDHGEHGSYRRTLASKLGLHGGGEKERSTMPIKRATGGSIPKLATGGAFRNLGKAIKHDVTHAANKVSSGAKNFARKEKEGFQEIGHKINRDVVRPSERGWNNHIENPARKAAATAKNMSREIGHDINKNAIKPAGRYLKESARKDEEGMKRGGCKKYAMGGMPPQGQPQGQNGGRNNTLSLPFITNHYRDRTPEEKAKEAHESAVQQALRESRSHRPPKNHTYQSLTPQHSQSFAPQQPMPMKRGGKTRHHHEDGGEAMAMGGMKLGLGKRVKSNVETRHNFQNAGRLLTGKKEKSVYGAKERNERKEKGLPRMAAGGVGKMRHEEMPKTGGSVNSPMRDRNGYM